MTFERIGRSRPRTSSLALVMILVMLFTPVLPAHAQQRDLPSIGGLGGGLLSDRMEEDIGEQVMAPYADRPARSRTRWSANI